MLKVLLATLLLYVVNQVHFPWLDTRIPGVPPANLLFLVVLLLMRGKPEAVPGRGRAYEGIIWFFGGLTWAFVWSQVRAPGDFVDDLTYLKNALFYPLFYFVFLKCRQDEKGTRQLIIWIMIIAGVAGLEAVREGLDYGFGAYNPMRRASGPFGVDWHNANRAAVFYAMFMPMFVALALFLKGVSLWRLAAVGGAALVAGGTLFTYSRQGYFLILLSTAMLLFRRSIVMAMVVGVTLVSLASYLPDSAFERVEETTGGSARGGGGGEEVDASTASRWELWAGGMKMLASNPLGVGLHRFPREIGNYSGYKKMDAHNFYVLMLSEGSVITFGALLFLLWRLLGLARYLRQSAPKDDPELTALVTGFTMCTACMMLGGIYGSPTLEGSVMAPYWALAGLLERLTVLRTQGARPEADGDAPAPLSARFPLAAYLPRPRG